MESPEVTGQGLARALNNKAVEAELVGRPASAGFIDVHLAPVICKRR
jgi:hypothetical protein